jgi:hypothetical protein
VVDGSVRREALLEPKLESPAASGQLLCQAQFPNTIVVVLAKTPL